MVFIVTTTRTSRLHTNVFSAGKRRRAGTVDRMSPNQKHTYPLSFLYSKIHHNATA
jgi:hypothetical protein